MTPMAHGETYPKTTLLHDGSSAVLRPLTKGDKLPLLKFFESVPEEERFYLKENVTAPEVVLNWTAHIDLERVIPIVAVVGDEIVADATLHRSRSPARGHIGELRLVVAPDYRDKGLGRRMLREILDVAAGLGLEKVTFELVAQREEAAVMAAGSMGFHEVTTLKEGARDFWGNYQDIVLMEVPLKDRYLWWW